MSKRAQGTIEYLLIIAIVLVIGLVVVGLISGFFNTGGGVDEKQSRIYWISQPLAIMDGVVDADGNAIFIIQNNKFEDKNFTTIIIDGTAHSIESGTGINLGSGDKYKVSLTGLSACNRDLKSYNITLSHTSAQGLDKNSEAHYYTVFCIPKITSTTISSIVGGDGIEYTGSPATGAFLIYDGVDWAPSRTTDNLISGIAIDKNTLCFNGCDTNIDWNGTDIVISTN